VGKWIQELIDQGYLKQELTLMGEKNYTVLLLTPRGREIMKKRETVPLSLPPLKEKAAGKSVSMSPGKEGAKESDKALFEGLRKLRLELARKEGLPPYCIFHDRTLWEMVSKLPTTQHEMMTIVGVGEITFKKYGRSFLDLISSYASGRKEGH
jgi:ATP-dependent DNA helicase RecQ